MIIFYFFILLSYSATYVYYFTFTTLTIDYTLNVFLGKIASFSSYLFPKAQLTAVLRYHVRDLGDIPPLNGITMWLIDGKKK